VFIFEMNSGATGLTVGDGSTVQLTGLAQACNVFWRLNTASIGTTAVFKGNILALTSITVANGANIEGRLLARNGNVTLNNDTITRSTCMTPAQAAAAVAAATASTSTTTPGLPNTGIAPKDKNSTPWSIIVPTGVVVTLASLYAVRKKRAI
jgi:hypothetical protein